jgi:hypothetical protein
MVEHLNNRTRKQLVRQYVVGGLNERPGDLDERSPQASLDPLGDSRIRQLESTVRIEVVEHLAVR